MSELKLIQNCDHKKCVTCLKVLPANEEYFYKQKRKNKKYGEHYILTSLCRDCMNKKNKDDYRNLSVEAKKRRRKNNYANNKEKEIAKVLLYQEKNKKIIKEIQKEWRQNNKDKLKEYQEQRSHKNHDITDEEWLECKNYFNNECAYCGLHISEHYNMWRGEMKWTDFHKEHVDHNGANDLSNCIPACKSCNSSKHTSSVEKWYINHHLGYSNERYEKITKWLTEDYKKYIQQDSKPKRKYKIKN